MKLQVEKMGFKWRPDGKGGQWKSYWVLQGETFYSLRDIDNDKTFDKFMKEGSIELDGELVKNKKGYEEFHTTDYINKPKGNFGGGVSQADFDALVKRVKDLEKIVVGEDEGDESEPEISTDDIPF